MSQRVRFLVMFIAMMVVSGTWLHFACAESTVRPGVFKSTRFGTVNITGDGSGTLSNDLTGGCLYAWEVKCTDDDAITVAFSTKRGTAIESITTTTASSGEADLFSTFLPANHPISYTVTGYGDSAGCTLEVTIWER
jgi:hypothetical protein